MAVEYRLKYCIIYLNGYMGEGVSYETGVGIVFRSTSFIKPVFVSRRMKPIKTGLIKNDRGMRLHGLVRLQEMGNCNGHNR